MKYEIFSKRKVIIIRNLLLFIFVMPVGSPQYQLMAQAGSWKAPSSADSFQNPYKSNEAATLAGKKLFTQLCVICHGNKGKGDGIAGMALKPRPADFTKEVVQNQTDGALFWKMTEGKAPMAAYKTSLTEEQRWQLVNFIRQLVAK